MHYEEASRRFNLLAGLGLGSIVGASLGIILAPQKGVRLRRSRRASRMLRLKGPERRLQGLRASVRELVNGS